VIDLAVATFDAGGLLAWLGLGGVAMADDLRVGSALVVDAVMSEAVHYLAIRHEGNAAALAGDLLMLELAPILSVPVVPLVERAARYLSEESGVGWATACAGALAARDAVPLASFHMLDLADVITVRLRRPR
jgi:hypothetical protein